jgi:hypothetical protein
MYAEMHTGRPSGKSDIDSAVYDDWNIDGGDEQPRDRDERPRALIWQPQLNHGRATAHRGLDASLQAIGPVAQVVRDRNETQMLGALHARG